MVERPLVSILVPCYNAAPWLASTLESALQQSWPRIEIIVVDDGSSDNSLEIARGFEPRGVRVFAQANSGAASARNHALRHAKGDFIQFLDADDLLAPDKIERQLNALARVPLDTLAAGEWARFIGDPETAVFQHEAIYNASTGIEFLQIHYETGSMMQPGGWLAPRSLLDRAGPWNEALTLNDDGEYFARVMIAASCIAFTPGARCFYRATPKSLSRRRDSRALVSLHRSVELTPDHLLKADASPRTQAAAAYAWKWTAFELYPDAIDLSRDAEEHAKTLGGSTRPFPGGRRFQFVARLLGWRIAKSLILLVS